MSSFRSIIDGKNDASNRDTAVDRDYDPVAGAPAGVSPQGKPQQVGADPSNPPEPAAPASNLKR